MSLNGLINVNVELTSRCNKNCPMCGRRERDRLYGDSNYGDMDWQVVQLISSEMPDGIIVQLHNNGEGTLYPRFGDAVACFKNCITNIVTNGKLLVKKADEIIDNLDILSISIVENDVEAAEQYAILEEFLRLKGSKKPYTTLRFVGNVDQEPYAKFGLQTVDRVLHDPKGSTNYKKKPTIPEVGVCWDFMTRLAIDRHGDVSVCVRFDPDRELVLGNIRAHTLDELWNSKKRLQMKKLHCSGRRGEIPYCGNKCHYWGVPVGRTST